MSKEENATVRTRRFMKNPLLKRRQMVVDVIHHGRPNVPKTELATRLGQLYKKDVANIVLFGFKTAFGGGKSTGFALIYDDASALKEFEPKYRLIRSGVAKAVTGSRKQRKERKNRRKKLCSSDHQRVSCHRTVHLLQLFHYKRAVHAFGLLLDRFNNARDYFHPPWPGRSPDWQRLLGALLP
jgi:small subunit ribosomal protein S24e